MTNLETQLAPFLETYKISINKENNAFKIEQKDSEVFYPIDSITEITHDDTTLTIRAKNYTLFIFKNTNLLITTIF